ncbi:indolepyruvate ferredoxin oxidoreductase subunit alpha [Synergistes jonesii]|uniref:Indolepyruvate oxidoreductase subunit IorA n=1 Tax=Synergistes jonesii TaxID=2754 RepID=A0A073ITH4_9BACT|nr:indolepyruvate ferredoxin oxidoreductase subunit alpha [Synergistes jonesii]KEJ92870.1 indolepyruvate ferredoxin oxidoreductase [Synergistes jonesii]OFB64156.1 indolepyruvate ferredoxin oxidoreductase [Synergistes jonesii]OFB64667.1 indolepyruvate ferredoxin oxidoreductase [Synergistes jonesii]OFB65379.1 indolepyruvate ferredoxin oxidoreductase [Synergistes jonesii]OFB68418.1 indolepyruvate ferredoxin oxidoreductase [Synergistes jonesii]
MKPKYLLTGNEAIARGAYEAGVKVCSSYPGTPSTEIFENLPQYQGELYCEWAPNEKVAVEVAYGAAIAGARSLCAMKHVGVNVAADPLFTAAYNGVNRGFVIVTADDPSMHSSQNEQDNRYYAKAAKVALVEPSDSQECIDFLKEAYKISERFDMPVLFRTTTRISHSKSLVSFSKRQQAEAFVYKRNVRKNVCTPANAYLNHPKVETNLNMLQEYSNVCPLNQMELRGRENGVITASIAYQYAKEVFPEDTSFLKLGLTYPMPMDLIRDFASKVKKLYVIEELEPFMEEQIKAAGIDCIGKELVSNMYELNPQRLREMLFGVKPETKPLDVEAVSRPPALCPGCPHRGFFYTMAKGKNFIVTGDIGCYTLGAAAPLNAMDTTICMGGGFTVGMGMAKAFEATGQTEKKVFGVVGDSTFFHSGLTGAVEIIYNRGQVIPVVLDNHITGMTGHQDNPGTGYTLQGEIAASIKIEEILKSCGYKDIFIVDPQDLAAMQKAVDDALASEVPGAIITRRPCLLTKRTKHDIGLCVVDAAKCIGCKKCLSVACPAVTIKNKKCAIDPTQCVGCTVCAQVCPVGAISRKEGK